jgi:hypothetical protein
LKLDRRNDETQPCRAPVQARIERDEAAIEELGQSQVLGVVGFRPSHFIRKIPCSPAESALRTRADRSMVEWIERPQGLDRGDIPAKQRLVECRSRL